MKTKRRAAGPFVFCYLAELFDPRLNNLDLRILLLIRHRIGDDEKCWPSWSRTAADLGLSIRTVMESTKRLTDLGFLYTKSKGFGTSKNKYLAEPSSIYNKSELYGPWTSTRKSDINITRSTSYMKNNNNIEEDEIVDLQKDLLEYSEFSDTGTVSATEIYKNQQHTDRHVCENPHIMCAKIRRS